MAEDRSAETVLAEWREAERQIDAAEPGSQEAARLVDLAAQLHEEFRSIVAAKMESGDSDKMEWSTST